MPKLELPPGWSVKVEPCTWRMETLGTVQWGSQAIVIYPPCWAFCFKKWVIGKITQHELGHVWGIKKCKKPYCLMYEGNEKWDWLAAFIMIFNKFRFCKECEEELDIYIRMFKKRRKE
jgi:hypothetical protein